MLSRAMRFGLANPALLTDLYTVRDDLQRIIVDLTERQQRQVSAIEKAEADARESQSRMDRLEAQLATLVMEVQDLRRQQSKGVTEQRHERNVSTSRTANDVYGNPSRRTEPRKLFLASSSPAHTTSPDERKIALDEIMPRKATALPLVERSSSPELDEQPVDVPPPSKRSQGIGRMLPAQETAQLSDKSVHAESKLSSRKRTVAPLKFVGPRDTDTAVSLPGPSKLKPKAHADVVQSAENSSKDAAVSAKGGPEPHGDTTVQSHWTFESEGVPVAALFKPCGPKTRHQLEECLGSGLDYLKEIDNLVTYRSPRFPLCLIDDLAFIYDPLTMESNEGTILINWCTPKYKHFMQGLLKEHGQKHGCKFHTFSNPRQYNDSWWYLGLLEWTQYDTEPFWPLFSAREKRNLVKALAASWDCGLEPIEIVRKISSGELVQYTVHVKRPEDFRERTQAFLEDELDLPRVDVDIQ